MFGSELSSAVLHVKPEEDKHTGFYFLHSTSCWLDRSPPPSPEPMGPRWGSTPEVLQTLVVQQLLSSAALGSVGRECFSSAPNSQGVCK